MSRDFSRTLARLAGRITYNYPKTRLHGSMGEALHARYAIAQSSVHIVPLESRSTRGDPAPRSEDEERGPLRLIVSLVGIGVHAAFYLATRIQRSTIDISGTPWPVGVIPLILKVLSGTGLSTRRVSQIEATLSDLRAL